MATRLRLTIVVPVVLTVGCMTTVSTSFHDMAWEVGRRCAAEVGVTLQNADPDGTIRFLYATPDELARAQECIKQGRADVALRPAGMSMAGTGPAEAPEPASHPTPKKTLQAFASDQEVSDLFKRWAGEYLPRAEWPRHGFDQLVPLFLGLSAGAGLGGGFMSMPAPPMPSQASVAAESFVNVQHAGVGEGGIVARHSDHLVI